MQITVEDELKMEAHKKGKDDTIPENEDLLTKTIGEFGKWQKIFLILVVMPPKMVAILSLQAIVFLAPKTTFKCVQRLNSSLQIDNSTCYSDCVEYEYYSNFDNTIISEWNLICNREWLADLTQTLCMFGVFIGGLLYGYIADRFGRRPASIAAFVNKLTVTFILPLSTSFWMFTSLRLLDGLATAGIMIVPYILILEITGPRVREIVNCCAAVCISIAQISLSLFGYYLRSWDSFILGMAIPHLLFFSYFFFIPESPKWLISVGNVEQAKVVMMRLAKCNHLPTEHISETAERMYKESTVNKPTVKATYLDLILKPSLRVINLLSCIVWFLVGLSYYGSNQYIGQTSQNAFFTIALAGVLHIPGVLLGNLFCKRYGRRITLISMFVICALSNAMLATPDDWVYFKAVVGSIGVACAGGAFSLMYMFTSELFPTVTRNMALGASSTASRIGSMGAPFIAGLGVSARLAPPAVFAAAPFLAAVGCYYLPETRGILLKDHIED